MTKEVKFIHTLGPTGTNCEAAANYWFDQKNVKGEVVLHDTLESAVDTIKVNDDKRHALLGCVVYPDLHDIVFDNLTSMELKECFMFKTYNMVMATNRRGEFSELIKSAASHLAPSSLLPENIERKIVTSNSKAAELCSRGETDGCITTIKSAKEHNLQIIQDFGKVDMGFTIHTLR